MKVLLVMTGGRVGGLQQSVVPYASALLRAGHEVLAVVLKGSPYVAELQKMDITLVITSWPRKPWPLSWFQSRIIKKHAKDFEAEIAIAFASKGLAPTLIALKGDIPVLTRSGETRRRTMSRLLGADGIIVTSDEMGEVAHDMGMPQDRVFLLPNFLDRMPLPPATKIRTPQVIGSLGRLVPRKGFEDLLKACHILNTTNAPVQMILGGDGPDRHALEELAAKLQIDVNFSGWISSSEKFDFFENIDIFVCPSRAEPFGYIYLEAMCAGVPIVTTDTVGARFIFTPGEDAYIVEQDDIGELAKMIRKLLSNTAERRKLACRAQKKYLSRFHVDTASGRLDEILDRAVAKETGWK